MKPGVKVFSATKYADREHLGDKVTTWLRTPPQKTVSEYVVTQSSDSEYHCLTITVIYQEATR